MCNSKPSNETQKREKQKQSDEGSVGFQKTPSVASIKMNRSRTAGTPSMFPSSPPAPRFRNRHFFASRAVVSFALPGISSREDHVSHPCRRNIISHKAPRAAMDTNQSRKLVVI